MDTLRQFGTGILLAVISVFLIIGGFTLSAVEGKADTNTAPTATFELVIQPGLPTLSADQPTNTVTAIPQEPATETQISDLPVISVTPGFFGSPTALFPFIVSPTTVIYYPTVASCTSHIGYTAITVKTFDTLNSLALYYNMTPATLMQVNCLTSEQLQVGQVLYVVSKPVVTYYPAPTYNPAPTQCGAPYGWVNYSVVSGDTLYNISVRYRVTVAQLKSANCLGSSDYIQAGQSLKVPYVATSIPQSTATGLPTATMHPSSTPAASQTPVPLTVAPPTAIPPTEAPPSATTAVQPTTSSNAGPSSSATPYP